MMLMLMSTHIQLYPKNCNFIHTISIYVSWYSSPAIVFSFIITTISSKKEKNLPFALSLCTRGKPKANKGHENIPVS